ncbi:MAG: glycosyltransferase family 4 protein [Candidatus Diapherotrites archaeon]|nr:glycosyltransferase family 4 protein [Candidatus Diapherotrites archaeon]
MRVLHVSHRFAPCIGGVETHVMQLCDQLARKGHSVRAACLNKCPNLGKTLPVQEKISGIEVKRLRFLDLRFYKIAPGILGELKGADIVHVHGIGFFSDILALTKIFHGKKLVLSTHGAVFHTEKIGALKKIYFNLWCRLVLRTFNRIIAVSESDAALFAKIVPKQKIALIENPVDVDALAGLPRRPLPDSILFVGRLSKNKGLPELLQAIALVKKDIPDVKLTVAGEEFDLKRAEVEKIAGELGLSGNVVVAGKISDERLAKEYVSSVFFASASRYEGFGISAIEAMAAGLIPVLNNIPTFRGFVEEGGNGFIADFSDPHKAAGKIKAALRMDQKSRERMSEAAKRSVEKFGWKEGIEKFAEVYEKL